MQHPIKLHPHEKAAAAQGQLALLLRPCDKARFPLCQMADAVYPARVSGWIAWQGGWGTGEQLKTFTKQQYEHGFPCPLGNVGDVLTFKGGNVVIVEIAVKRLTELTPLEAHWATRGMEGVFFVATMFFYDGLEGEDIERSNDEQQGALHL